jgi:hypothetical protein
MSDLFEPLDAQPWDSELAADLVGGTLLVGLTYLDARGALLEHREIFGRVVSCDPEAGIVIRQASDETFTIAPVLDAIDAGEPGLYHLANDQIVEDPDFTALITVTRPDRS